MSSDFDGNSKSTISNFFESQLGKVEWFFFQTDPTKNGLRPHNQLRFWIVIASPLLLLLPIQLLAKIAVIIFLLLLVANFAQKFGVEARIPDENLTKEEIGEIGEIPSTQPAPETNQIHNEKQSSPALASEETIPSIQEKPQEASSPTTNPILLQQDKTLSPPPPPKPILYVCTKCEVANNENLEENSVTDIESIIEYSESSSPSLLQLSRKKKKKKKVESEDSNTTGKVFYTHILEELEGNPLENQLEIQPVRCMSTCSRSNCIAFSGIGKYTYQFGDLNHEDSARDVLEFAEMYVKIQDGYTKTRQRPERLKDNLLARVPPLPLSSSFPLEKGEKKIKEPKD